MAVTSFSTSSATLVVSTETFINVNVAGVFVFVVDLALMAAADTLIVRCYQMHTTAGTARIVYERYYYDVADAWDLIVESPPMSNELTDAQALRFSLTQSTGTGRAIPRKVLQHA